MEEFRNSMTENIIEILHRGQHSLVISNGGDVRTFDGHGVADLYALLREDLELLDGAFLADKVVGKAAAALMVLAGVREVYADVISVPALSLLIDNAVRIRYGTAVLHIINRTGTGWCPLETRCSDCLTPQDCFSQIEEFIKLQTNK